MDISEKDMRFLERRKKFVASWNATGTMLLVGLVYVSPTSMKCGNS